MGDSDSSLGWTTLNISDSILKSHGHFIFSYEMIAHDRFKSCRFRFNSANLLFLFFFSNSANLISLTRVTTAGKTHDFIFFNWK